MMKYVYFTYLYGLLILLIGGAAAWSYLLGLGLAFLFHKTVGA